MINVRMPTKQVEKLSPKITVLGVGGAGGNAVNNMISSGLQGCEFIVCNTDAQALDGSLSENKVQLGAEVTGGLGAGAKPEIGRAAAEESIEEIASMLDGVNMAFITAGMGGGTGTGAAPVIAKACRELGVLTVGVVTKPFHFEGTHRMRMAEEGIREMQGYVDTLIVIPNQNLFRVANEKTTFAEAFKMADSVLQSGVRGVTDLMVMPGLINLDFADVRSAMLEMGKAMMGTGEADGERRAVDAAESAINNPLLDDVSMKGARGVIINVTGGMDMTLFEVDEACNRIRDEVDPNANIIFGSTFDENLEGVMRVSVVATGIDVEEQKKTRPVGTTVINSITGQQQQERKLERAQPNAAASGAEVKKSEVSEDVSVQPSAETSSGLGALSAESAVPPGTATAIPTTGPVTASSMSYAAALAATKKTVEVSSQSTVSTTVSDVAEQSSVAGMSSSNPRGTVYKDSFIPPQPVAGDVSTPVEHSFEAPAEQPQQTSTPMAESAVQTASAPAGLSARKVAEEESSVQTATGSGLTLRPPVPGANAQKKRSQSLFERITNPLKPHHKAETSSDEVSKSVSPSAAGSAQVQGSLNIDMPQTSAEAAEDELDIPAFLRRQAN